MVKGEDKQISTWKIGSIDKLFVEKDSVIRSARMKTAKEF